MAEDLNIGEIYATRRWGHGRLLQVARRLRCRILGHQFSPWHFDWPYDYAVLHPDDHGMEETDLWDAGAGAVRDPKPDEMLPWARTCRAGCGCLQTARAPLTLAGLLPGERRNLYDHPLRKAWRR